MQLGRAARALDVRGVSALLLAGVDAGAPVAPGGVTALHAAVQAARGARGATVAGLVIDLLLQHGARVSTDTSHPLSTMRGNLLTHAPTQPPLHHLLHTRV